MSQDLIRAALSGDERALAKALLRESDGDGVIWLAADDSLLSSVITGVVSRSALDEHACALVDFLSHHHGFTRVPAFPDVDLDETVVFDPKAPPALGRKMFPAYAGNTCVGGYRLFSAIPIETPDAALEDFARNFAISFQARDLRRRLDAANTRLREISEIGRIFADVGESERTMSRILELAVQSSAAETGAIIHIGASGELRAIGMPAGSLSGIRFRSGETLMEKILAREERLLLRGETLAADLAPGASPMIIDTIVGIRLADEGRVHGAMVLMNVPGVHFDDESFVAMIETIARLAAAAMTSEERRAAVLEQERTRQELRAAKTIQESLLPKDLSVFPNLEIAALWKPSRAIGGDYYDVIDLGHSRIGIVIADVSGKGLPAGILMAACRSYLRVMALDFPQSPGAALSRLNKMISAEIADNKFITAAYVVLHTESRRGRLANAGHHPPAIFGADGSRFLEADTGLPIGVLEECVYPDIDFVLEKDETLLLFTDGLLEARDEDGEMLGAAGLKRWIADSTGDPLGKILDSIWKKTLDRSRTPEPADDWTVVAARVY